MAGHKMATRNAEDYFRSVFGGAPPRDEDADDVDDHAADHTRLRTPIQTRTDTCRSEMATKPGMAASSRNHV